jgi:hypothetical protein
MRADELQRGDEFRLHVWGQVLSATPVTIGKKKRIKIRMQLENQGNRTQSGFLAVGAGSDVLEFTDEGCSIEFLVRPGRDFHVRDWGPCNPPRIGVGPMIAANLVLRRKKTPALNPQFEL